MKKNRKWFAVMLILMMAMIMSVSVQAASKKSLAVQAYKQFLGQSQIPWDSNWTVKSSNCYFGLVYINNDTVPELVVKNVQDVSHAGGYGRIYTYKNGKVQQIAKLSMNTARFSYYKKKSVYKDTYSQSGVTNWYIKLSGTKAVKKLDTFTNTAKMPWLPKGTSYYKCGSTNKKISKSAFNKALDKLVDGKKVTNVILRKNTEANQKKYLKLK